MQNNKKNMSDIYDSIVNSNMSDSEKISILYKEILKLREENLSLINNINNKRPVTIIGKYKMDSRKHLELLNNLKDNDAVLKIEEIKDKRTPLITLDMDSQDYNKALEIIVGNLDYKNTDND
ncbi:hypothetical protein SHELI_v1c04280 [Spiroplasma helicoides]|uniref:Uncharacterized protein n=1 Tax=Spiroplasma helicoides TaxID=216938 RepID=A0A1B3SKE2_9MOLU|nr:hypothetical protein [Spiroplasma helicoides]AOG60379.1 hypothetical protein SHELI_v1c04280 [Spiroplasma helicoides]